MWKSPVWPSTWTVSLMSPSLSLKITHFIHPRSKPSSWLGLAGKVTVTGTPFPLNLREQYFFFAVLTLIEAGSSQYSHFLLSCPLSFHSFAFPGTLLCKALGQLCDAWGSEGWEHLSWGPGREHCAERECVEKLVYKLICSLESLQKHSNSSQAQIFELLWPRGHIRVFVVGNLVEALQWGLEKSLWASLPEDRDGMWWQSPARWYRLFLFSKWQAVCWWLNIHYLINSKWYICGAEALFIPISQLKNRWRKEASHVNQLITWR